MGPKGFSRFSRERRNSPEFSCMKFFPKAPDKHPNPTQIAGHPGHSLTKTTEEGALHKVLVRDIPGRGQGNIPMSWSLMSQDYPAPKTLSLGFFFRSDCLQQDPLASLAALKSRNSNHQAGKRSTNPNFCGYLQVGWGSSAQRGGGQDVRCVPRSQGNQTFGRDLSGVIRANRKFD